MGGDLQVFQVEDLIASGKLLIGDGYRAKNDELSTSGLPFARAGNINDGFRFEDADRFPRENLHRVGNKVSRPGDVVFTSKGTVGRFALVQPGTEAFVYSPQLCFWRSFDHGLIEPRFLYYWMYGREFYLQYKGVAGQTDMAEYVSLTDQRRMYISLPEIAEQRAIARILGALDEKIELNRKMNATIEAMARALFKSCFVQEPEADWRTAPLAEWVDVLSGGTPSKSNAAFWGGPLKWISPKAMTSIHADECDDHVSEQAVGNGTRIAPKGSTLVMVRGMGLHDGVRVSQAREDVTFNQDVKALVPRTIEADLLLFAMLDAQEELHKRVETSGHGTGKMPSEILLAHPITMPPREVQRERAIHISALNDRIGASRSESRSLARMRDDLLPRLLSGELPVDGAERAVEEVA
jgi:restriction endonuclease S subunit